MGAGRSARLGGASVGGRARLGGGRHQRAAIAGAGADRSQGGRGWRVFGLWGGGFFRILRRFFSALAGAVELEDDGVMD